MIIEIEFMDGKKDMRRPFEVYDREGVLRLSIDAGSMGHTQESYPLVNIRRWVKRAG